MRGVRDILAGLAAVVVTAASAIDPIAARPRIAASLTGLSSDDLIVYTQDATEYGADKTGQRDSTEAIQLAIEACDKAQGGRFGM